ncbi:ATP-binding protein [Streptomyces sp. NPDC052013]|uniref:ATP-binding protein n=1 Tax=Streptomyces sp. NPDC052013 TaxID=3365679 RepID=UPI0037CE2D38
MNRIESLGSVISAPEQQKSLTLAANDRAPGKARSFTREALTAWGVEDLMDQAVLIVSELTTNAERHGRTPGVGVASTVDGEPVEEITVTLALQAGVVGIEVEDNSPEPPVPQIASLYATSGRGLHIVAAAADAWTACPKEDRRGKRVIALVRRTESPFTSWPPPLQNSDVIPAYALTPRRPPAERGWISTPRTTPSRVGLFLVQCLTSAHSGTWGTSEAAGHLRVQLRPPVEPAIPLPIAPSRSPREDHARAHRAVPDPLCHPAGRRGSRPGQSAAGHARAAPLPAPLRRGGPARPGPARCAVGPLRVQPRRRGQDADRTTAVAADAPLPTADHDAGPALPGLHRAARTPLGTTFLAGPGAVDTGRTPILTNQPPVCARHVRAAAALCSHLEKNPMVFLARSAPCTECTALSTAAAATA